MTYTKTTWQNDQAPAINANNLNKIEDGIFNNDAKITEVLETIGIDTDTWESSSSYELGNVVIYNDKLYKNITGNYTTTNPAEDTTNWQEQPLIANWPLENTARVNSNLLPIADDYTETSAKIYSCDYLNGTTLYESSTGTNGNITLGDDISNYRYIEIIWGVDGGNQITRDIRKYEAFDGMYINYLRTYITSALYLYTTMAKITGTSLTIEKYARGQYNNQAYDGNYNYIYKIVGYK